MTDYHFFDHPLESNGRFKHIAYNPRFQAHEYAVTTKTMGEIMRHKEPVPHLPVFYINNEFFVGCIGARPTRLAVGVAGVIWRRWDSVSAVRDSIATLLMMGNDQIVVIRSFRRS